MKRKVLAYVTHGDRLLILRHPYHPDAGLQIPGGTVAPDERPEAGVLREVVEETGLRGLQCMGLLGESKVDMSPWGKSETHHRFYFHVVCHDEVKDRWRHVEQDPSEGPASEITFEFYWAPLNDVPELIARHDEFIDELIRSMA